MHKLATAFVATCALAGCLDKSSYKPVAAAGGAVLTAVGGAILYHVHDTCESSGLDGIGDCLGGALIEGVPGFLLTAGGLGLLIDALLLSRRDEPAPHPSGLDDRLATEARLAAGAGNCTAVRAILDRIDPARRKDLEADPAIAACR
jgi:hypothetical protein